MTPTARHTSGLKGAIEGTDLLPDHKIEITSPLIKGSRDLMGPPRNRSGRSRRSRRSSRMSAIGGHPDFNPLRYLAMLLLERN